jgi:hypothetical protein
MAQFTSKTAVKITKHAPVIMVLASYLDSEGPLPNEGALTAGLIDGRHVLRVEKVDDHRGHVWWPSNSYEALQDIASMVVQNDAGEHVIHFNPLLFTP